MQFLRNPRVGEIVTPQNGSAMIVEEVEHVACSRSKGGTSIVTLVPHVYLRAIGDDDGDGDDDNGDGDE